MERFVDYIIYFTIFSVVGYLFEVISGFIFKKKLADRGFLFGPYLPIYGFGGLLILATTAPFRDNLTLTIAVSMAVCTLLEYVTSYVMEKIFKVRWWDYSKTDTFNIQGRICVRNTLVFGIGGAILSLQVYPMLKDFVLAIPADIKLGLAVGAVVVMLLDTLVSSYANGKFHKIEDVSKLIGDQATVTKIKKTARKVVAQKIKRKK